MSIYDSKYFKKVKGITDPIEQNWKYSKLMPALDLFFKGHQSDKVELLEIGAGTGQISKKLVQTKNDYHFNFTCIEINKSSLKYIKKNIPGANIYIHDLSKKRIELPDKKYDLCLCIDVIEHIDDFNNALTEIKRLSNYAVFKIPAEKTVLMNLINFISLGSYRKKMVNNVGHIHWFTPYKIFEILKSQFDKILYSSFTNVADYQLNKHSKIHLSARTALIKTFYFLSSKTFQLSPKLNSWLFCDHLVILVKC